MQELWGNYRPRSNVVVVIGQERQLHAKRRVYER